MRLTPMTKAIKNYGKNVAGGAKIVAKGAAKIAVKPFKWAGNQIEKEVRMNKAKDDLYRKQGAQRNRDYSGL